MARKRDKKVVKIHWKTCKKIAAKITLLRYKSVS